MNDSDIHALEVGSCTPAYSVLQEAQSVFNQNLNFDNSIPREKLGFTIPGIKLPDGFGASIASGMASLSVSINDKGAATSISYANKPATPQSLSLVERNFESRLPRYPIVI